MRNKFFPLQTHDLVIDHSLIYLHVCFCFLFVYLCHHTYLCVYFTIFYFLMLSISMMLQVLPWFNLITVNEILVCRVRNKLWYFEIASQENFSASCRDLADKISIEVRPL